MSKQIRFYATENDKNMIADILKSVFGELLDVPRTEEGFSIFNEKVNAHMIWLVEKSRVKDIVYRTHENYDGITTKVLNFSGSPVIEYSPSATRPDGGFFEGRFYCCCNDKEFLRKVSQLFTKLRKEFIYVRKYQTYLSPNIDFHKAKLGPVGSERIITEDDLSV